MSELEKMKMGLWYDANYDENLVSLRMDAQDLCRQYGLIDYHDQESKDRLLKKLFGYLPKGLTIIPSFLCDYGTNIHIGNDVFINAHCYLMDGADIKIGSHVFIGPYCGFFTATHPLDYKRRNAGLEKALPIVVKDNCWFGANVSVMPGVTIGEGCVIGAGSVVTKDIPDHSLAVGVPAKVIKTINQDEEI